MGSIKTTALGIFVISATPGGHLEGLNSKLAIYKPEKCALIQLEMNEAFTGRRIPPEATITLPEVLLLFSLFWPSVSWLRGEVGWDLRESEKICTWEEPENRKCCNIAPGVEAGLLSSKGQLSTINFYISTFKGSWSIF